MSNFKKRLEIDCDDEFFMSGKIILSWKSEDQLKDNPLRICKIYFDLQRGEVAVLRYEEIEELIDKLNIVKNRLQP